MKLSKRKQTLAKENVKGMLKKQNHHRKQLDTIVYLQTNHTIVYHDHIHFKLLSIDFNLLAIDFNLLSSKRKNNHLRKQLDTIVYPQTNHTIVYHDHSCFFAWLRLILWKAFGFDSKKNEAKQRETNFSKGKGKGNG